MLAELMCLALEGLTLDAFYNLVQAMYSKLVSLKCT